MINRTTCIFCGNPLDGSDEHIIPESINGRLHSKKIVCHDCNVNKFGSKVDTILSETFSLFIHLLGLKNARTLYVEDPEGRKYTRDKKHRIKQVKPELSILKKDGLLHINISGDEHNAFRLLRKQQTRFQPQGGEPLKLEIKRETLSQPPLSTEITIKVDRRLTLVLNKMVLEFYAYNGFDVSILSDLLGKVGKLDFSLDNVAICNFRQEVRVFDDCEISHLLVLKTDEKENVLYGYVELFNLVCGVIVLKKDYAGPAIDVQYRQDAISGTKVDGNVVLSIDFKNVIPNVSCVFRDDFSILVDLFCERHRDKIFHNAFASGLEEIKLQLKEEMKSGALKQEQYADRFIKLSAEHIAYLTVYKFPYAVSDLDDAEDEMINYIHSSMKVKMFDEFCSLNKKFIGFGIAFTSENHEPEKCVVESFMKTPVGNRNGEEIVKVYCVLRNVDTGQLKYIPFRNLFEALRRVIDEKKKEHDN